MKHYLLEYDGKFEMSEQRVAQLLADRTILECPHHQREFTQPVKTYHLTLGTRALGILDIASLVRDVS
jgi:hypothetical protein